MSSDLQRNFGRIIESLTADQLVGLQEALSDYLDSEQPPEDDWAEVDDAIDEIVSVLYNDGQPWTSETIEHVAAVVARVRDERLWVLGPEIAGVIGHADRLQAITVREHLAGSSPTPKGSPMIDPSTDTRTHVEARIEEYRGQGQTAQIGQEIGIPDLSAVLRAAAGDKNVNCELVSKLSEALGCSAFHVANAMAQDAGYDWAASTLADGPMSDPQSHVAAMLSTMSEEDQAQLSTAIAAQLDVLTRAHTVVVPEPRRAGATVDEPSLAPDLKSEG